MSRFFVKKCGRKINVRGGFFSLLDIKDHTWVAKSGKPFRPVNDRYAGVAAYAKTNFFGKTVTLHRILMGFPLAVQVDHINGDGMDNRRANLRIATRKQNSANRAKRSLGTSKYKGVCFTNGRWIAQIGPSGTNRSIGSFPTERDAAIAYNEKAIEMFGDFARLNQIKEEQ